MNFLLEQLVDANFRPAFERLLNLLSVPRVSDVLANAPDDWWIDRGAGLEPVPDFALTARDLKEVAVFLVALGDRHLDLISPVTDVSISTETLPVLEHLGIARLRVHAVLESELSERTVLSIRVHPARFHSMADLAAAGMFTSSQERLLADITRNRESFLVSGAGGSGKTTLLRAMLAENPELRTVVVEDTAEILPVSGHVIGLQTRQANTEGAGAIGLETLARQALRMRPDRLIIGEVRGSEVGVLLQAMNTGHSGSASTIHANGADQVATRLKTLALGAGFTDLSFPLVSTAAVQWVVHLKRSGGTRRVESIEEFKS